VTADELRRMFPKASTAFIAANASAAPAVPTAAPAAVQSSRQAPTAAKSPNRRRVPLVRNAGTWSEAKYWGTLRSGLRRLFRFWRPAQDALRAARVSWPGRRGRKHGYRCSGCGELFMRRQVHVDHIEPCGALTSLEHVADFIRRLTAEEPGAFQVLCIAKCHRSKTKAELTPDRSAFAPAGPRG